MEDTENPEVPENAEVPESLGEPENKAAAEELAPTSTSENPIPTWGNETDDNTHTAAEQLKSSITHEITEPKDLDAVFDVPVQVSAVLGRAIMPVHQLLKLGRGAVIELDRRVGEAIDVYVNNLLVARGEVVVVEDKLGITMTEIIKTTHKA